jgi:glycosyltransferase involved in cell wall biosynthesis
MLFWIPFAIQEGNRIVNEFRIDSIVVSAPPNSSLWIGSVLKRKHNIRFVADLRDPVVDNLFEVSLIDPRDAISKIEKRLLKRMERSVVQKADAVVVTTSSYKNHMIEKYGKDTFYEVKNSFDEDDYAGVDREKYENFTISHTGSIIGLRGVDLLFRAIKRLVYEAKGGDMGMRVLLVGENDPRIREMVSTMGLKDYVKIEERVSHREAIEIMVKSHLLLLVKETFDGKFLQIPAKFYEYMGSMNKILCLGPDSCEEAIIIKNLGLGHVVDGDEGRLVEVMRSEYLSYRSDPGVRNENPSDVQRYECHEMARNYYKLLRNCSIN